MIVVLLVYTYIKLVHIISELGNAGNIYEMVIKELNVNCVFENLSISKPDSVDVRILRCYRLLGASFLFEKLI
jgi:hypothetical protein